MSRRKSHDVCCLCGYTECKYVNIIEVNNTKQLIDATQLSNENPPSSIIDSHIFTLYSHILSMHIVYGVTWGRSTRIGRGSGLKKRFYNVLQYPLTSIYKMQTF